MATGFGFGFSPFAPGTMGALWGVPIAWALGQIQTPSLGVAGPALIQIAVIVVLGAIGVPLCTEAAKRLGDKKDPGAVVWDEIASMPITFFLVPLYAWSGPSMVAVIAVGFVLNRIFDIIKPPPCPRLEKLDGGLGIMADDWAAGIYSCISLHLCLWAWSLFNY